MSESQDKYNVMDLINYAVDQKPLEFERSFAQILQDRAREAIELKKAEMAASLFNDTLPDDDTDWNNEDDESLETDEESDDKND
jgi:hypothetical protein